MILENHLHWIAAAENLEREIAAFKSFTARRIFETLARSGDGGLIRQLDLSRTERRPDRDHQLWQRSDHPKLVATPAAMLQKLNYLHENPVRRGYVARAEDWVLSSAGDYLGRPGVVRVETRW